MILQSSLTNIFINIGPSWENQKSINTTQCIMTPLIVYSFALSEKHRFLIFCKSFDVSKSSLDIPNKLTKLAAEPVSVPFTKICNQSGSWNLCSAK